MTGPAHPRGWDTCFPEVAGRGDAMVIDDGWDFEVVRVGDDAVRVPRRAEVEPCAQLEVRVLPELARRLPVRVPEPTHVCATHGAMVYPWLAGAPLDGGVVDRVGSDVLGGHLAAVVSAVQQFPPDLAVRLGLPRRDQLERVERFERLVVPVLPDARRPRRFLQQARELLAGIEPCVVHGDLGPAHVLCDDHGLVGVIDWADLALGDPALDLAWMLNGLGRRLREPVLAAVGPDADLVARAEVLHRLGPWSEVLYGLEHDLPAFVETGTAGVLARLPD